MTSLARFLPLPLALGMIASSAAQAQPAEFAPLVVAGQGSFSIGGTVRRTPGVYDNNRPTAAGQSFHGDHLYAFYQTPRDAPADRHVAWRLPVGAELGDHARWP